MAKKSRSTKSKPAASKKASASKARSAAPKKSSRRASWLDPASNTSLIDDYARKLESYTKTLADGRIEQRELAEQEKRLTALMKKIEPQLDDDLHEQVTQLLCETTVFDTMQFLHTMQESRHTTRFRG
jgi:hypothetical protein